MPDFIIIDKGRTPWNGKEFYHIVGQIGAYDTLSEALKAADAIKAEHGGIIANISGATATKGWDND